MTSVAWLQYDSTALASLGVDEQAAYELSDRGLPTDCYRMFVREQDQELSVRELPQGRAAFLGAFEDGVNTYWLVIDSGEVWMVRGYEGGAVQQYGLVNSSVAGLHNVLKVWEGSPDTLRYLSRSSGSYSAVALESAHSGQ